MNASVSLREVARRAGCSPQHVCNLLRLGILGKAEGARSVVVSVELADALATAIRGGVATQPIARLMAEDPRTVIELAELLEGLARAALDQRVEVAC